MGLGKNKDTYFNYILTRGYQNPTEESLEIFKKPTSALLFQTTKPSPTTRGGEKSIALDGSLGVCFYRL